MQFTESWSVIISMFLDAVFLSRTIVLTKRSIDLTEYLSSSVNRYFWSSSMAFFSTRKSRRNGKQTSAQRGGECSKQLFRRWQHTPYVNKMLYSGQKHLPLRLLSYNVLAQDLLEDHQYLYRQCKQEHLIWKNRWRFIMAEIVAANPDIICLQEVQNSHFEIFYNKELSLLGYEGLYKKRTGARVDGVGLWYRSSLFQVDVWSAVEFNIPGEPLLDRDNVAIVARLVPKTPGWRHQSIVVATTHLLYNARRHDIKLAQTQLLLAEIEALAYRPNAFRSGGAPYWPVIITGDFNLQPYTGVYKFLTEGKLVYEGLCANTLIPKSPDEGGKLLGREFISPDRGITDNCQYVHEILQRLQHESGAPVNKCLEPTLNDTLKNIFAKHPSISQHQCLAGLRFSSGTLTHPFNLRSVYVHGEQNSDTAEATTKQDDWCSVDYIFYSDSCRGKTQGKLELAGRFRLFTRAEAKAVGPIPNDEHPSDHYPLIAHFVIVP